ncbi:EAL domain-containing protein [Iodobacter arcticus]|uniref:EAL domain-containing protein n=1 Tax=Iodobacter arcticus TaxID=590593 RepID=A0ABW2QSC1_9NEIS
MSEELEGVLRRAIEREKKARQYAESLVEERTEALRLAYEKLRTAEEQEFFDVLSRMPCAVLLAQNSGEVALANPAAVELLGFAQESDLIGRNWLSMVVDDAIDPMSEGLQEDAAILMRRANGEFSAVHIIIGSSAFLGSPARIIILHDVSEQRRLHQQLRYQATHDGLTGLPNRQRLLERLGQYIASARMHGAGLCVFFIDLDKFKFINDSMGHAAGDVVLCEVARRLQALPLAGGVAARLGGDEFVVAVPTRSVLERRQMAQVLLDVMLQPIRVDRIDQVLGSSIGAAQYPEHGCDAEMLLKRADIAMYHAKESGGSAVCYFTEHMQEALDSRLLLESRLRYAISHDELVLYYQPQVDLSTGMLVSVEALVRWQSPDYGLLFPGAFIALAEEVGLIRDIGAWVMVAACQQILRWHQEGLGWVRVAVNVSPLDLVNDDIVIRVASTLASHGIPPECLELEITESLSISDPEMALDIIGRIKALGVALAIDDFGVGYSNLGYLKRFPAERLKIDQSFVRGLSQSPHDKAIVATIIQLARSLSMQALAEGVETEEEARILFELGAHLIQGYWISKAVPSKELVVMLRQMCVLDTKKLQAIVSPLRVLVIDDNPIILDVIQAILTTLPLDVHYLDCAEAALECLAEYQFSAIICDYQLPGEDGISFLAKAKTLQPTAVRILITASTDLAVLREAINIARVEHFLQKPFDPAQLIALMNTLRA